jgi:transcriptional regulator with XRE-family HTH domain
MTSQHPHMRMTQTGASERLRLQLMAAEHVERIGQRIRERREELGLSRDDLARKMPGKTNGNAIYRWERGRHEARPDALEALADALDVPVAYFFVDEPDRAVTPDPFSGNGRSEPSDTDRLDRMEHKLDRIIEAMGLDTEAHEFSAAAEALVEAVRAVRRERLEADGEAAAARR